MDLEFTRSYYPLPLNEEPEDIPEHMKDSDNNTQTPQPENRGSCHNQRRSSSSGPLSMLTIHTAFITSHSFNICRSSLCCRGRWAKIFHDPRKLQRVYDRCVEPAWCCKMIFMWICCNIQLTLYKISWSSSLDGQQSWQHRDTGGMMANVSKFSSFSFSLYFGSQIYS